MVQEQKAYICSECKKKFSNVSTTICPKCSIDISEMQNPKILKYVYYHCTKKKDRNCSQKSIKVEDLESQFNKVLEDITIDQDYLNLALDYLQDKQKNSSSEEKVVRLSLQSAYDDCQKRLVNLSKEFTSPLNSGYELYTPEEFKDQKKELKLERERLERQIGGTKEKLDNDLDIAERVFNFCAMAKKQFNTDNLQRKRQIFSTIGTNLILNDKKLLIERLHPYLLIENELKDQMRLRSRLEPKKHIAIKEQNATLVTSVPNWLRSLDDVRTCLV